MPHKDKIRETVSYGSIAIPCILLTGHMIAHQAQFCPVLFCVYMKNPFSESDRLQLLP